MSDRTKKIMIVGGILLLILLIIFIVALLSRQAPSTEPELFVEEPAAPSTPLVVPAKPAAPEPERPIFEDTPFLQVAPPPATNPGMLATSDVFAERYGSYSNQNAYQNLRDLLPLMTPDFRKETEAKLKAAESSTGTAAYQGVTSVKISSKIVEGSEADRVAKVAVTLQQTKESSSTAPTTSFIVLELKMIKFGEDWLVDQATWIPL
jgi:hypothetical protein